MANKLYSYKDRLNAALGVALRRQYSIPLDVSSIFLSLADFQAYVKQDKTYTPKGDAEDIKFFQDIVPYSYSGQIVSVIDETTQTSDVYVINKVGPLESNETIEDRYTNLTDVQPNLIAGHNISISEDNIIGTIAEPSVHVEEPDKKAIFCQAVDDNYLIPNNGKPAETALNTLLIGKTNYYLNASGPGPVPSQEQTLTLVSDTDGNIVLEKVNGKLNVTSDPDGNVVIF